MPGIPSLESGGRQISLWSRHWTLQATSSSSSGTVAGTALNTVRLSFPMLCAGSGAGGRQRWSAAAPETICCRRFCRSSRQPSEASLGKDVASQQRRGLSLKRPARALWRQSHLEDGLKRLRKRALCGYIHIPQIILAVPIRNGRMGWSSTICTPLQIR